MDNPETLATQGKQDEVKQSKNKITVIFFIAFSLVIYHQQSYMQLPSHYKIFLALFFALLLFQIFTQAYKIKNAWTIKHYLIDSGRGFEAKISKGLSANKQKAMQQIKQRSRKKTMSSIFILSLSYKFLKPLINLLRRKLMSLLCQKLSQALFAVLRCYEKHSRRAFNDKQ
jgi:hypothetical protein